jgi:hypothetical protein
MNVAGQFSQISVRIHEHCLATPLKKMTRSIVTPVGPPGVTKTQILQNSRKRDLSHLDRQVYVGGHETESVDTMAKSFNPFLDKKAEASPILIIKENTLPVIAAQDDVV